MIKKLLTAVFPAILLCFVIWNIEPPISFTSATPLQLIYFFLPAFLFLTAAANIVFDFWLKSIIFGLGITILLIFKALGVFNIASVILTIIATVLIIYSLKKPKKNLLKHGELVHLSRLKKQ